MMVIHNVFKILFNLSLSDVTEIVSIYIYFFIYFSPIIFLILCSMIYCVIGLFATLSILLIYFNTYLSSVSPTDKIWRWCHSSNFWSWLQKGVSGRVIIDNKKNLKPNQPYIFGFHPHGAFPLTGIWALNSDEFLSYTHLTYKDKSKRLEDYVSLVSSMILNLPFLREIITGIAGQGITKEIFAATLQCNKNVILSPGGVAECILTPQYNPAVEPDLVIFTKHKGFIKYAIKYGRPLVPILSFGEQELFDIAYPFKPIEKLLKNHINDKITIPWLSGRYGLPIPRNIPITVVFGKPIKVVKNENPTNKEIDKYHALFYGSLRKIFNKYKNHPDVRVKYANIKFV